MSNNIDMGKLGDGDNEEWKKAYPILLSRAKYQLLWTLGIPQNDWEDIALEAMAQAYQFPFEPGQEFRKFKTFYLVVCKRRAIDWMKKQNTQKRGSGGVLSLHDEIGDGNTLLDILPGVGDLNKLIEEAELMIGLEDCTSVALNEKEKEIYTSFLILGEGYKEIAENMQIPEGSIGTTISRCKEKLKDCLSRKGFHERK